MTEFHRSKAPEPPPESFQEHYLKFIGDQPTTGSDCLTDGSSMSTQRPSEAPVWLRPSLMGIGSVAATVVIGSALTEQANQPAYSSEYPTAPQPGLSSGRQFQSESSSPPPSPAAIAIPAPPELIRPVEAQASRRPLRDLLAEQRQQRGSYPPNAFGLEAFRPESFTPRWQTAIAPPTVSPQSQAHPGAPSVRLTPTPTSPSRLEVALADLPQPQATPTDTPAKSRAAIDELLESEQAPATHPPNVPDRVASSPASVSASGLNKAIALKAFALSHQVSTPERLEVERASTTPLPIPTQGEAAIATDQPETPSTLASVMAQLADANIQIQPLTATELADILQWQESLELDVVQLPLSDYHYLQDAAGAPSTVVAYGIFSEETRIVMLPQS